jgi:hypothetical protein
LTLARLLPSVLLVVVAGTQIVLARTAGMTPWKGGGFGMFSTLDHGAYRGVEAVIEGPNRSEALEIPPSLEELAARAATCPTDWLLRQLAERIVSRERRYERSVSRVTLTAWRTEFDRVTLRANERTLRTYQYDVR